MPNLLSHYLAAGWLTLNWVVGYGVAPVLFSQLNAQVAGSIMAILLSATYWADLIVLVLMLVVIRQTVKWSKRERWLLVAMVAVVTNLTWVSPLMSELKQIPETDAAVFGLGFAAWHGVSQLIFLCAWLSVLLWGLLTVRTGSKAVLHNS
ncbi:DUF4149 domain-containing protein [Hydrogenovibrio sp. SC-1]|uniref:DUF4149 domain-containing protein n=1 Tax=Hydrogenovibrio sp. SC-1 TaxID=2065820 RepID=UPI000C79F5CE|nr:DUF4149 domain-containing protein [Hydrogenovibrio sp. SC-1]PLA74742.1 DUF4149 domain-containing protein [Hydrogenovibrio sp. SC-1]